MRHEGRLTKRIERLFISGNGVYGLGTSERGWSRGGLDAVGLRRMNGVSCVGGDWAGNGGDGGDGSGSHVEHEERDESLMELAGVDWRGLRKVGRGWKGSWIAISSRTWCGKKRV